jgi:hypothetical protein
MMASLGNVSSCSFKETFIAEEADFLGIHLTVKLYMIHVVKSPCGVSEFQYQSFRTQSSVTEGMTDIRIWSVLLASEERKFKSASSLTFSRSPKVYCRPEEVSPLDHVLN